MERKLFESIVEILNEALSLDDVLDNTSMKVTKSQWDKLLKSLSKSDVYEFATTKAWNKGVSDAKAAKKNHLSSRLSSPYKPNTAAYWLWNHGYDSV